MRNFVLLESVSEGAEDTRNLALLLVILSGCSSAAVTGRDSVDIFLPLSHFNIHYSPLFFTFGYTMPFFFSSSSFCWTDISFGYLFFFLNENFYECLNENIYTT